MTWPQRVSSLAGLRGIPSPFLWALPAPRSARPPPLPPLCFAHSSAETLPPRSLWNTGGCDPLPGWAGRLWNTGGCDPVYLQVSSLSSGDSIQHPAGTAHGEWRRLRMWVHEPRGLSSAAFILIVRFFVGRGVRRACRSVTAQIL